MTDEYNVDIALLKQRLDALEHEVQKNYDSLEKKVEEKASKAELQPVKVLVFGFVGVIMMAVVVALTNLVVTSNKSVPPTITGQ